MFSLDVTNVPVSDESLERAEFNYSFREEILVRQTRPLLAKPGHNLQKKAGYPTLNIQPHCEWWACDLPAFRLVALSFDTSVS